MGTTTSLPEHLSQFGVGNLHGLDTLEHSQIRALGDGGLVGGKRGKGHTDYYRKRSGFSTIFHGLSPV